MLTMKMDRQKQNFRPKRSLSKAAKAIPSQHPTPEADWIYTLSTVLCPQKSDSSAVSDSVFTV